MIKIQNISKTYNKIAALKNVSVNLFPSQSIALIGPNGSGTVSYTHLTLPTSDLV
mgnify:CR=1 FL=1